MPRRSYTLNFHRLLLVGSCIFGLLFLPATGMPADQKNERQPPALITIENFENGETVRYDLPLLTGTAQGASDLVIYVNGATTQWSVNDERWRAFVSLREGTNHLTLMTQGGGYLSFRLEYQPLVNDKTIRLVYLLGSDSAGNFDAPPGVPNALVDAIPRIRLAGRMMQSLAAEMIADKGLLRQTFRLLTAADQVPIVETQISPLSVNELRSMDGLQLWFHFVDLMRDIPDRENTIDLAIIADTHFDPSIDPTVPLAHTALGARPLALFGGGSIHSWPAAVDEIESRYTDSRPTEPFLFPEFGRSNQYWSNATTSVGAAMHELGHTFGLPHPDPGDPANFMNRGFDYLNRTIVTFEPGLGAIDPASDLMPRWDDSSIAILQDNPWFATAEADFPYIGDPVPGIILNTQLAPGSIGSAGVIQTGGLSPGVEGFVDRTGQQWQTIPTQLIGADFIQTAQDNADVHPIGIDVTVAQGTILHMFIPEHDDLLPFEWMNQVDFGAEWVNTGAVIDTSWAGDAQVWSTSTPLPAGTYRFRGIPTNLSFYGIGATQDILPISIDIKPRNRHNIVNPRKKGKIWVALLSDISPESPFDPSSQVDIPTVEFGPDGAKAIRHKVKDVNNDGLGDLLLRFKIPATGIACGDTEATLIGETFDGLSFDGTDLIKTVGCKSKKHNKKKHHKKH